MSQAIVDINELMERGPDAVLEFLRAATAPDPYDPRINWLLLAESSGFEATWLSESDPPLAARWAGIAVELYERMIPALREDDEVARRVWSRSIEVFRAKAAGVVTPSAPSLSARSVVSDPVVPSS